MKINWTLRKVILTAVISFSIIILSILLIAGYTVKDVIKCGIGGSYMEGRNLCIYFDTMSETRCLAHGGKYNFCDSACVLDENPSLCNDSCTRSCYVPISL